MTTFELILEGFAPSTDATDNLVKWVNAPSAEVINHWARRNGLIGVMIRPPAALDRLLTRRDGVDLILNTGGPSIKDYKAAEWMRESINVRDGRPGRMQDIGVPLDTIRYDVIRIVGSTDDVRGMLQIAAERADYRAVKHRIGGDLSGTLDDTLARVCHNPFGLGQTDAYWRNNISYAWQGCPADTSPISFVAVAWYTSPQSIPWVRVISARCAPRQSLYMWGPALSLTGLSARRRLAAQFVGQPPPTITRVRLI